MMRIRRNRLRPKYADGCGNTCGRKLGYCPERLQTRADTGPTKSRAGRRIVGLPEPLARYQHVLDSIRKGVADQVGGLLWGTQAGESAD